MKNLLVQRTFRLPRLWSNQELRKLAHLFSGKIINVSGWKDEDKEGGFYKDYFINADSYYLSNYGGKRGESVDQHFEIDLEGDIHCDLIEKFDVVFNHTTLEHIFDVFKATSNLCKMTKDIVVIIVPFVQPVHHQSSYLDYWRFTHYSLKKLLERNGLETIYLSSSPFTNSGIYHLCVGSKKPSYWKDSLSNYSQYINEGKKVIQEPTLTRIYSQLKK